MWFSIVVYEFLFYWRLWFVLFISSSSLSLSQSLFIYFSLFLWLSFFLKKSRIIPLWLNVSFLIYLSIKMHIFVRLNLNDWMCFDQVSGHKSCLVLPWNRNWILKMINFKFSVSFYILLKTFIVSNSINRMGQSYNNSVSESRRTWHQQ